MKSVRGLSSIVIPSMPLPSLSNTAARTVNPTVGASPWAFGSQGCSAVCIGVFLLQMLLGILAIGGWEGHVYSVLK